MKFIRNIILCSSLAALVAVSGCNKKSLHDLNINPQAANTLNVNFLLTYAQLGAASGGARGDNRFIDWRTNIGIASTAIQHLAATGDISNSGDKYLERLDANFAPFEFLYTDLRNLDQI